MRYRSAAPLWLAGLAALLLIGCATRPTTPSTHTWPQPCNDCVPGLRNFSKVNDGLWRAAQPDRNDADVFRKLERAGVKTVINLRHDHDDFPALAREETYRLMCEHADHHGANAIISMRYDATELMAGLTGVLCYGTAVLVEAER